MFNIVSAPTALQSAAFGEGSGEIHLDDVACTGNEQELQACSHSGVGTHNCRHSEDASVTCPSGNSVMILLRYEVQILFFVSASMCKWRNTSSWW